MTTNVCWASQYYYWKFQIFFFFSLTHPLTLVSLLFSPVNSYCYNTLSPIFSLVASLFRCNLHALALLFFSNQTCTLHSITSTNRPSNNYTSLTIHKIKTQIMSQANTLTLLLASLSHPTDNNFSTIDK